MAARPSWDGFLKFNLLAVPVKAFNYSEQAAGNHDAYLWGNAAFALATRVADSFAKFRWCPNIIGPMAGGTVGHMLCNLRVVDDRSGRNVGIPKAIARVIIKSLLGWYSFISMATTRRRCASRSPTESQLRWLPPRPCTSSIGGDWLGPPKSAT